MSIQESSDIWGMTSTWKKIQWKQTKKNSGRTSVNVENQKVRR